MPGTLPVVNKQAIDYAVMFGLAIDADIGMTSVFERKNYFYPDLPKGYQTTQLEQPIVGAGVVDISLKMAIQNLFAFIMPTSKKMPASHYMRATLGLAFQV